MKKGNSESRPHLSAFSKALCKSLFWTLITIMIGLLQLLVVLCISYNIKQQINIQKAIYEGVFLFFAMTLIAGIVVDYYFSEKLKLSKPLEGTFFVFIPFFVAVFSISSYSTLYIIDIKIVDLGAVAFIQYGTLGVAIVYSIITKFILFLKPLVKR